MNDIALALMTGGEIPVPGCQVILHQPTIYEIGYMGETQFFQALTYLCIDKSILKYSVNDEQMGHNKVDIEKINNFMLLQEIFRQDQEKKELVHELMLILFPSYSIVITPRSIIMNKEGNSLVIDEDNFPHLQGLLKEVFCLQHSDEKTFNPKGKRAEEIARKLMQARQRVAAEKRKNGENESSLAQYISVLTVGVSSMSLQNIIGLTVYQIYDLVQRLNLYMAWDLDAKCRLAGGKPEGKPDNWMKKLH